jgi:predicted ATPase/signal transduction histidine kinase
MMFEFPGYQTAEKIGSNDEIMLYRLLRLEDGLNVIAKTTRDEYPGPAMVATFQYEYDILTRLGGRGAVEAYSLEIVADRPILLLQDIGGSTLAQVLSARADTFGLPDLLRIAISTTDCLIQIHREKITLNEISPLHLVVNVDTFEVKFIDIRMCSTNSDISPLSLSTGRPDSILPYISPEQTGRTGMALDYRTDFYSLGIALYECLSGSLPFGLQDVAAVVYHHLASIAEPLHHRFPSIPKSVSDIIGKCMEKVPDARYASAFGIKSDLEECAARLQASENVESFALATRDIPNRWMMEDLYYGRQSEQQSLQAALKRASEGATEVVWISGNGGIGKTSFVEEVLRKEVNYDGFFVTGKFVSDLTSIPYDIWIQIIGQLASQLLMENRLQAEVWKLRILKAVDDYGQLLIELVPKLELLIGPQPPVQPLPPVEAQNRFHLIITRFLQLFLHRDRPLALFLDDLQWADEASLQYLGYLLEDRETKHLLVAVAYRDGEITAQHPLDRLEKHLLERSIAMSRIHLHALEMADLKQLLSDAMRDDTADVVELAAVLLHKTEGNPFFLKQFIQDLIEDKQVTFDESSWCWRWNLQLIVEKSVPDNVAAYLLDKLSLLPSRTIYTISRGAFLGNRFDIETLAQITEFSLEDLAEMLAIAVRESLLQPVDYGNGTHYKFQHDHIQQAAYALVSEAERVDLHFKIGSMLVQRLKLGEAANVYETVNHMNQAWIRIIHPQQKLELAELNLQAGLKAKQSTAYESSLGYMRFATELLAEESWDIDYSLTFRAFRERAEAEYLCAHYEMANELFNLLVSKAATSLDKALVYTMKIQLEASNDNYEEVISLGRKALQLLNVRHNFDPSSFELAIQWLKLSRKIRKYPIESLNNLPVMTDETCKVAMSVLVHTSNACFFTNKKGWVSLTLTMVEMTLDYGMTPEASIGFVGYAMVLYFQFSNFEDAFKWGMHACSISKPFPTLHIKTLTSFSLCFDSWRRYDPNLLEVFTEHADKVGLESGDLWHGNQSVLINCGLLLHYGYPLEKIYERLLARSGDFLRLNNDLLWKQAAILAALLVRLTGYRAADDPFASTDVYAADFADSVHGDEFDIIRDLVCSLHYLPGYMFGHYREANEALIQTTIINESRKGGFNLEFHSMYDFLVAAQLYEDAIEDEQRVYWVRMESSLQKMKQLAKRSAENYGHKYLLFRAEIARLTGKNRKAELLYEQSIESARLYGHIHDSAIAAESYGRYALRQGKQQLAKIYMTEAYKAFLQWGAAAKAADLEHKYGYLLEIRQQSGLESVDYLSVVLSAQALSGEMEMTRLLDTLMRIMLHNAGAEFGALLFDHEGDWIIEAYGTLEQLRIESIPLEEQSDIIPAVIVGYAARTNEEVVLHDAAREGMFVRDPSVRSKGLKSVLCLPLMYQNKLICLLYMENKLSPNVFTPKRLDVLKLLGSQCAISIANAKLYSNIQYLKDNLEDQVEERTRSLERSMRETSAALAEVSVYEERNRIAHEIHDIVGHTLTSTILQIEAGKRLINKDTESATVRLKEAQDLIRHSLNEIRGSVHMLKEDKFSDFVPTLNQLIRDTERNTGVVIDAAIHELPVLSTAYKKTLYHALQEGLTNGIRHGRSTKFLFSLEFVGSHLQFRLEDRGIGANTIVMGFGLKAMKERAEQLSGSLSIESQPNQGCLLRIDLPYLR